MISTILTATNLGLQTQLIEIEVDLSPAMPAIVMVGLPDKAVQESKERIRSSLKQSGYEFPLGKLTINLAPADIAKSGSAFDLPIAVSILKLMGFIKTEISKEAIFLGELSLQGQMRKINGVLTTCIWAKKNGFKEVFIPYQNQKEASLVDGISVYPIKDLSQLVNHLNETEKIPKSLPISVKEIIKSSKEEITKIHKTQINWQNQNYPLFPNDMAYVKGQEMAKRALEIAASGGHNVLFIGQPGSGKTLLARAYPTILPDLTHQEVLEVTQIYSVAGLLKSGEVIYQRPFRGPHHTASNVSLVGGGAQLKPGEISLAHRGVLFLDEFPEFDRKTIETLRQPLEDGFVTISRARGSVEYPSRFYLLAAANPTPSGFDLDDPDSMGKPQNKSAIMRYQSKFSGPILDRIDLQVEVNRPKKEELQSKELSEPSILIAQRVQRARDIQNLRFANENIQTNSEMTLSMIQKYCELGIEAKAILDKAIDKFKLSGRSYTRLLKLSRTIADLENSKEVKAKHIAESLQYRGRWK